MQRNNDNLERILGSKLREHSVAPPAAVWERLERSLAQSAAAQEPRRGIVIPVRRNRIGAAMFWRYAVAAALLLGAIVVADSLIPTAPKAPALLLANSPAPMPAGEAPAQEPRSGLVAEATAPAGPATPAHEPPVNERLSASGPGRGAPRTLAAPLIGPAACEENAASSPAPAQAETVAAAPSAFTGNISDASPNQEQRVAQGTRKGTDYESSWARALAAAQKPAKKRGRRVGASLFASNVSGMGGGNASPSSATAFNTNEIVDNISGNMMNLTTAQTTMRRYTEVKLEHRVPVTVGVSFSYAFSERFAVESGVSYTYMHSKSSADGVFNYRVSQKLHYVGIPLSVSCNLVSGRRASLYVRAGAALERAVSATQVRTFEGDEASKVPYDIAVKGVQASLNASLGAELHLSSLAGVYFEPGISHFFDNDQPASYRTEHPTSLSLKAGVRFHF